MLPIAIAAFCGVTLISESNGRSRARTCPMLTARGRGCATFPRISIERIGSRTSEAGHSPAAMAAARVPAVARRRAHLHLQTRGTAPAAHPFLRPGLDQGLRTVDADA